MIQPILTIFIRYLAGYFKSTDGGQKFERIANGVHGDHQSFWIDPENSNRLLSGSDGGFQVSYDGGKNWDIVNNVTLSQFYQIFVDDENPYNVLGGLQAMVPGEDQAERRIVREF